MAKTFYLIRHGEKQKVKGDPGLSERGVQQAQLAANFLAKYPISLIYEFRTSSFRT